jgi:O-antigen/teichoic acid export membrane protein
MQKLINNTVTYGIGSVSTKLIGIAILPLLTMYLSPSDFGVIGILTMLSIFLNALMSLGFGTSIGVVFFETEDKDKRQDVILTAFWGLVFFNIILLILIVPFSEYISEKLVGSVTYYKETLFTVISTSIMTCALPFMLNIQFQEKAKRYVAGNIMISFLSLIAYIIYVVVLKKGLIGYFYAFFTTQLFTLIIFLLLNNFQISFKFKKNVFQKLLKHGIPMIPSFFSLFVLAQSNRYILKIFSNIESVGIYTIGYNIGSVMQLIINAFSSAWTPYFLSFINKQDEVATHFGKILRNYTIIVGFIVVCFFVFGKVIIMVFINENYIESYKVIGFVALSNFFIGLFNLFLPPIYFEKEVHFISLIQIISSVLSIIFNVVLIYFLGFFGAAIALSLGYLTMALLTYLFNRFVSKSKIKKYEIKDNTCKLVFIYSLFSLLSLINRDFTLLMEIFFAGSIFALMLLSTYFLLSSNDKIMLKKFILSLIKGR